ncbi:MAG TPA: exosortase/archaeosortase family protein [Verrucomicrobiae bacterium]|nr:exosortase/archaeosortase family protein [Verrucomicrobiae bacterium]
MECSAANPLSQPASRKWWTLLAIGILWLQLCLQLRVEWTINPQYQYGWGVPFLALYLLWVRWPSRPKAIPPSPKANDAFLIVTLSLTILPIRLIQESNPDWRPISWLHALIVVALSLEVLYVIAGSKWARHFLMPVMLILVAVPWPSFMETPLVQNMMNSVAALTVELIRWTGNPAWRRGNIIELAHSTVGVDEACSGVRSLQSTLMAAIFLGGLYQLSWKRRALLLGGALGCSMGLNFVRAYILALLSAESGNETLLRWHDTAGFTILIISFAALWALARYLERQQGSPPPPPSPPGQPRLLPPAWIAGMLGWLVATEVATAAWYASHEKDIPSRGLLRVSLPQTADHFQLRPLPATTRQILRCDSSESAVWVGGQQSVWQFYLIGWQPGQISPRMAKVHHPELCLSAAGMRLVADNGLKTFPAGASSLPIHTYLFESRDRPVYVFFTIWEDRVVPGRVDDNSTGPDWRRRLGDVRAGRRQFGQQMLEVAITGVPDQATAENLFAAFARASVTIAK